MALRHTQLKSLPHNNISTHTTRCSTTTNNSLQLRVQLGTGGVHRVVQDSAGSAHLHRVGLTGAGEAVLRGGIVGAVVVVIIGARKTDVTVLAPTEQVTDIEKS